METNFFAREFPDRPKKRYSDQEMLFYLEILPQNKKQSLINKKPKKLNFFRILEPDLL